MNFGGTTYTATDDLAAANINNLTFTSSGLITIAPSLATNVLTLTTNAASVLPSIYVGSGGAVIQTILAGTAGFVKNGAGVLTLNTNADTFTGIATVNAGTLALNIGQSTAAGFAMANGATSRRTSSCRPPTLFMRCPAVFHIYQYPNGIYRSRFRRQRQCHLQPGEQHDCPNQFFSGFGGTATFGNNAGLRLQAVTTASSPP